MDKRSIVSSTGTVAQGVVVTDKKLVFSNEALRARQDKFSHFYELQKQKMSSLPFREIEITLPDGKKIKGTAFKTTPLEIALGISKSLAEKMVVAKIKYINKTDSFFSNITNCDDEGAEEANNEMELLDMNSPIEGDCMLELKPFDSPEGKETFWHSSAHLLGRAIEHIYQGFLTHGPPLKTGGFFYDAFIGDKKVTPEIYKEVEKKVAEIVSLNQPFEKLLLTKKEALELFGDNPFKVKMIESKIEEGARTTAYRCGDFIDLCTGPHIVTTSKVKAFKVLKNAACYWLGNQKNDNLQRIYAVSFESKKQLDEYVHLQEELAKRDHRNIIEAQQLVHFNPLTPGCAFYLPHGTRLFNTLIAFVRNQYRYRGFCEVNTPNLFKTELWKMSGHYFKYKEDMFYFNNEGDDEYGIKPMNCPSHCLIFGSALKSYRDLPLRLADFGVLHRNEASGALGGLTRVRKFHQDDAHIFCREDQITEELLNQLEFLNYMYELFGFQYSLELSTRPQKYLGKIEQWDNAEKALKDALNFSGKPWTLNEGDGAFYGPKIDIKVLDCYQRKHQLGTFQLDFNLPLRFNLQYKEKETEDKADKPEEGKHENAKNEEHHEIPEEELKKMTEEERFSVIKKLKHGFKRPVIIHRAILGSLERCIAILCEHFGGKWPFWLSPRQIAVLPISDKFNSYAEKLKNRLVVEGYFADVDSSNLTLNKRIRNSQMEQYNVILVVGEKESTNKTVAVRYRDSEKVEMDVSIKDLLKILKDLQPKPSKAELAFKENALYDDDQK